MHHYLSWSKKLKQHECLKTRKKNDLLYISTMESYTVIVGPIPVEVQAYHGVLFGKRSEVEKCMYAIIPFVK